MVLGFFGLFLLHLKVVPLFGKGSTPMLTLFGPISNGVSMTVLL